MEKPSRRAFLAAAGAGLGYLAAGGSVGYCKEGEKKKCCSKGGRQIKLGLASYTFREFGLDETLEFAQKLGLKYIALKSFHLPLESTKEEIAEAVAKVEKAGLKLYGGGVIYMNDESEVERAFNYAREAGMGTIIGVPKHELLGLVDEKVQEYDIKVAIHNHGPGDKVYPTPESAYEKIKGLDKRIGLCIDVGHTQRSGVDPSDSAERFAERVLDVHIKDVSESTGKGTTVEIGRGVIDIPKFMRTLVKIKYGGVVSFEYEKDGKNPLAGMAESVGYVRGVIAGI
jgi:sugar phosphate isomerase/epimerase